MSYPLEGGHSNHLERDICGGQFPQGQVISLLHLQTLFKIWTEGWFGGMVSSGHEVWTEAARH